MSYLYRPTPVMNPGPSRDVPLRGLPAGTMRGIIFGADYKPGSDRLRAARASTPWIVTSGTMGNFGGMGDAFSDITGIDMQPVDLTSVPTFDTSQPLSPNFWSMPSPMAPTPNIPASMAPPIISSGGSILSQSASGIPSWLSALNATLSTGTAIAKTVTSGGGGGINPAIPPVAPSQSSASSGVGTSWFSKSTIVSGVPDVAVFAGGALGVALLFGALYGKRGK